MRQSEHAPFRSAAPRGGPGRPSPLLQGVAAYTNLWNHALDFSKGIVDSRNLVYYATSTALMLFLSVWTLAGKKGQ